MGDEGIKNLALRSILPSFNNHVMIMGKEMGIPFGIRFDDKFNCTLHHIGEEISPKTLSTGEKKKVDFVIIMALIKMIKMRFPSLNILFLDEIFSSIDADGVFHIINILHKTIQDIGLNTFVINHTVLPSEYFDKKLEITKGGGFSEFEIEKIN
jgi:DNA repair exonuclease SbcCD ATPase subunit